MILPYPQAPYMIAYQNRAFPIGGIQANFNDDVLLWAALKSANCLFNTVSPINKFETLYTDSWGVKEGIAIEQIVDLKKETYIRFNIDVLDLIKKQIDDGCYVTGIFNERYIPTKDFYGLRDYDHDFLIYGYEGQTFYLAGYVKSQRFEHYTVSEEELIQSLLNTSEPKIPLNFISVFKDKHLSYAHQKFITDLGKYLSHGATDIEDSSIKYFYGIAAIRYLRKFFIDEVEKGLIYLDMRYTRTLLEHKELLLHVIKTLADAHDEFREFKEPAEAVWRKAQQVHLLGIKMNLSRKASIITSVSSLMKQMIDEELVYLPKLYNMLLQNPEVFLKQI